MFDVHSDSLSLSPSWFLRMALSIIIYYYLLRHLQRLCAPFLPLFFGFTIGSYACFHLSPPNFVWDLFIIPNTFRALLYSIWGFYRYRILLRALIILFLSICTWRISWLFSSLTCSLQYIYGFGRYSTSSHVHFQYQVESVFLVYVPEKYKAIVDFSPEGLR